MHPRLAPLAALALLVFVRPAAADDEKPYREAEIPRVFTEWTASEDGKVAISLAIERTAFPVKGAVKLRCALRNLSGKPITILRPWGDAYYAESGALTILGPAGLVTYQGPTLEYALGTSSFVELPPKTVIEQTYTINRDSFPDFGPVGLYSVTYEYATRMYPKSPKPENLWEGTFKPVKVAFQLIPGKGEAKAKPKAADVE